MGSERAIRESPLRFVRNLGFPWGKLARERLMRD